MRLIHVIPAISSEASGPSYSVVRLCEALIARGSTVTLAALDWEPYPGSPKFLRAFPLGTGPRRLGRSPAMRRWLTDQGHSGGVDVLHSHGMWQMSALYPAWVARKSNVKLMVSPRGAFSAWAMQHGSRMKRVFWPALQRPAMERASCFHATADSEYEDIRRLGFRQPVAIIPNGIDIPVASAKTPARSRTLLFLGRLHPVKGLDMLLPAWGMLQDRFPEWQLTIAGSDEGYHGKSGYRAELEYLAQRLELKRVHFVGELLGVDKLETYRKADLFALPSYSENFGVAVAEALAAGTPAIVSKGAPWSGLVAQRAGWWIDLGVAPLTACLEEALSCPAADLNLMGMRGRSWVASNFSWEYIGAHMSTTYQWLVDQSLPAPAWVRLH